jgi:hypothetical protein
VPYYHGGVPHKRSGQKILPPVRTGIVSDSPLSVGDSIYVTDDEIGQRRLL